jgi:hypothetical protein
MYLKTSRKTSLLGAFLSYSFAYATISTSLPVSGRLIHDPTGENITYAGATNARSVAECTQVHCQVSVCAADGMGAWEVATNGLQFLMGQDCSGWQSGPNNNGQGPCASGLSEYSGELTIWRAWVVFSSYSGTFAQWGNFLGATCSGGESVSCSSKVGNSPNAWNGECY